MTTPASLTIARCQYAELVIGNRKSDQRRVQLVPVVTEDGQLNSLQSSSPATARGGYVLVSVEAIHGATCPALTGAACDCGAQRALENVVFADK